MQKGVGDIKVQDGVEMGGVEMINQSVQVKQKRGQEATWCPRQLWLIVEQAQP
jgi:hypothetical protein